ncbi:hypothetical protein CC79DRAFT_1391255 [Sarocladium strictum]
MIVVLYPDYRLHQQPLEDFLKNLFKDEPIKVELTQDERDEIRDRAKFFLRDLTESDDGKYEYQDAEIDGIVQAKQLFLSDCPDPRRRFCFFQSKSSRGALTCSRDQLAIILSRHQVMLRFMEFILTFQSRENPYNFASFRCEDNLSPLDNSVQVEALQKSGIRIQHCFNILAFEKEKSDKPDEVEWRQRQVAAYHSFDLLNGNVFWAFLKGNNVLQERIQHATDKSLNLDAEFPNSICQSLRQSLQEHLLLLQWGTENWIQYIEFLEATCRQGTDTTSYSGMDNLIHDSPVRHLRKQLSLRPDQAAEGTHHPSIGRMLSNQVGRILSWNDADGTTSFSPPSRQTTSRSARTLIQLQTIPIKEDHLDLENLVSLKSLQDISTLEEELNSAISVIDQNKRVFADIRDRYAMLGESALFEMHLQGGETLKNCQSSIAAFVIQARHLIGDLEVYQARLRKILATAERASEVYNCILQERNTRTAQFFATAAQESADMMQVWTQQMHQKTISMHLITIFTLIFLPGTFVATMFSSGIIIFGPEGGSGFGPDMGDWKIRLAGIKLFFAICIPLLAITLGVWIITYVSTRMRSTASRLWDQASRKAFQKNDHTLKGAEGFV